MPRSHPPTLITLVRAALREHALVPRGTTVLVAVSGGPDSMALLHVLGLLRRELAFGLFAHGVDHGLRPEAAAELDLAEGFARSLDVPFTRTRVDVAPGGNLQARARDARWAALRAAASRAGARPHRHRPPRRRPRRDHAHANPPRHGPRGLAVLPPLDGDRIRPMLRARRADVDAHVPRHRIPHSMIRRTGTRASSGPRPARAAAAARTAEPPCRGAHVRARRRALRTPARRGRRTGRAREANRRERAGIGRDEECRGRSPRNVKSWRSKAESGRAPEEA